MKLNRRRTAVVTMIVAAVIGWVGVGPAAAESKWTIGQLGDTTEESKWT
jgi:hypothetical protein